MKLIPLTRGQFVQVDDEDYDYLMQWKWHAQKGKYSFYATRSEHSRGKNRTVKTIWMHRIIMNTPKGLSVDHIDHNGLNCQKSNMRNCTSSQNNMNTTARGISRYLGVSYAKNKRGSKKYHAYIKIGTKATHLGYFYNEIDAAIAYNNAAKVHHGEFANLNKVH